MPTNLLDATAGSATSRAKCTALAGTEYPHLSQQTI